MAKNIGRNSNVNDTAVLSSGITLNATTSTTILAADITRIKVIVHNDGNNDVWIKFQAASVDNDKKGFIITRRTTRDIMDGNDIYTGEISAIAVTDSPTVYVTDY